MAPKLEFAKLWKANPKQFRRHLAEWMKENANSYWHMSIDTLELFADVCIRTAQDYGFERSDDIGQFSFLMTEVSPRFHQFSEINKVLKDSDISPSQRLNIILSDDYADVWKAVNWKVMTDQEFYLIDYWDERFDEALVEEVERKEAAGGE